VGESETTIITSKARGWIAVKEKKELYALLFQERHFKSTGREGFNIKLSGLLYPLPQKKRRSSWAGPTTHLVSKAKITGQEAILRSPAGHRKGWSRKPGGKKTRRG